MFRYIYSYQCLKYKCVDVQAHAYSAYLYLQFILFLRWQFPDVPTLILYANRNIYLTHKMKNIYFCCLVNYLNSLPVNYLNSQRVLLLTLILKSYIKQKWMLV